MNVRFSEPFLRRFKKLPEIIKKKFEKQLISLLRSLRHPSLRAKKYDETRDIWQARVNSSYRFYFKIQNSTYVIINIIKHLK